MRYAAAILLLAGCASPYAVNRRTPGAQGLTLEGAPAIVVAPNGRWVWREKPEAVVMKMIDAVNQRDARIEAMEKRLERQHRWMAELDAEISSCTAHSPK